MTRGDAMRWLSVVIFLYAVLLYGAGLYSYFAIDPPSIAWIVSTSVAALLVLIGVYVAQRNMRVGFGIAALTIGLVLAFCVVRYIVKDGELWPAVPLGIASVIATICLSVGHFQHARDLRRPPSLGE